MIVRRSSRDEYEKVEPKAFDDFELRLGDVMRGERATLGKSLLDVQRELRIRASYIAAIENCDPDAFDTPGFIAGYVRSYARYLGMDPDSAFADFCKESGFAVAHGMSAEASVLRKSNQVEARAVKPTEADRFKRPATPFVPKGEAFWSGIEPSAIGSSLVLICLISAIGYGGYAVLREVQKVQVAAVEQTPVVLSDLDPLQGALAPADPQSADPSRPAAMDQPRIEALGRLYRPQALDVPVLVPRDAPIASIAPGSLGNFAVAEADDLNISGLDRLAEAAINEAQPEVPGQVPQVSETPGPALRMVAVRTSWVRVSGADGTVIFEKTMEPGEVWDAPATEEPPTLRTGESGAIYFAMGNQYYGPAGRTGQVTSNLPLAVETLKQTYAVADLTADEALATMVAELQTPVAEPLPAAGNASE
ncbi:RodZ domain-containing protein [Sulfitobacter sp. LCG007]